MYDNTKGRSANTSLELAATAKTRFEEFLRRQLGVSDATDPEAVVSALQKRYPAAAARLEEEKQGVSIRFNTQPELPVVGMDGLGATAGAQRAGEVREALAGDLACVMAHPSNRDFKGALAGWRDAVLAEWGEGMDAAVLGADPLRRDRAFYSVRKLSDYARVARMVGIINPDLRLEYRRLATTLDEAGMVLRVRVGEALFRAGFSEGGAIFEVTLQDLRRRREALISSLERFTSISTEDSADWGDGESSYGRLLTELAAQGQQDLRSLVQPEAMARLLDVLLDRVEQQSQPELLHELAATAPIELVQLKRLRAVASDMLAGVVGRPASRAASAPLSAFVQALHLFITAFASPGANNRLLDLAIPFPFAVAQIGRPDPEGREAVRVLIQQRFEIATKLEALYSDPNFDPLDWDWSVKLDRVLYDLDRAIDLYLLGSGLPEVPGPEELRASLYGQVLDHLAKSGVLTAPPATTLRARPRAGAQPELLAAMDDTAQQLQGQLTTLAAELLGTSKGTFKKRKPLPVADPDQFLVEQRSLEAEWKALALQLSPPNPSRAALLEVTDSLYDFARTTALSDLNRAPEVPDDPRISLIRIADAEELRASPFRPKPEPPGPSVPPGGGGDSKPPTTGPGDTSGGGSWKVPPAVSASSSQEELERCKQELSQAQERLAQAQQAHERAEQSLLALQSEPPKPSRRRGRPQGPRGKGKKQATGARHGVGAGPLKH
ncbi:hypothetical protein [Vitiosangium sp. GDMCC 1.1324]|uniref:hypothetical protein n=1 Tax=Vitiosangium sp. (strain GDMCC 1.1324) TaxID=2138576 RepID=UPI000D381FFF|nr:hypothetical protein [Vitiosangium sp. GDMCC 1.1324]PTL81223.1 hypothetical protein DAT35_24180 [Vitiosangium sp. GDMCC 1.1324]